MVQRADEAQSDALRLDFDRRFPLAFHGSKVTSDAGLLAYSGLDDALGLMAIAEQRLVDGRTGRNGRHDLVGMLRQRRRPAGPRCPSLPHVSRLDTVMLGTKVHLGNVGFYIKTAKAFGLVIPAALRACADEVIE